MKVRDIMGRRELVSCKSDDTVEHAARLMKQHDVGSIPVLDGSRKLAGIVTDRDIAIQAVAGGKGPQATVSECMTRNPVTVRLEDHVERCADLMQHHQIRRIPVVDEAGTCVAMVAQSDLARKVHDAREVKETVAEISRPKRKAA